MYGNQKCKCDECSVFPVKTGKTLFCQEDKILGKKTECNLNKPCLCAKCSYWYESGFNSGYYCWRGNAKENG